MMQFISTLLIEFIVFLSVIQYILSIMSGDSPNAFTNEHTFDFTTPPIKDDGRSSPTPTTSKDNTTAAKPEDTILIEPATIQKGGDDETDKPEFQSPINNNPDTEKHCRDTDKTLPLTDTQFDGKCRDNKDLNNKNLINGEIKKDLYGMENQDDKYDDCIVNCLYYTGECCRCSIM